MSSVVESATGLTAPPSSLCCYRRRTGWSEASESKSMHTTVCGKDNPLGCVERVEHRHWRDSQRLGDAMLPSGFFDERPRNRTCALPLLRPDVLWFHPFVAFEIDVEAA